VATSLHSLGLVLEAERRWADAEPLFREALASRRKLLGEVHPAVADSLNRLVSVLRQQGKLDEAKTLLDASPAAAEKATSAQADKPL
jgi:hypothetical protein